jgi:hypothetical protein
MEERRSFKEVLLDFLTRLLPVVTGIAITFTVQGLINRAHDHKSVLSALELVRTELKTNLDDIEHLGDFLDELHTSAKYLVDHKDNLKACPAEIVRYHQGIVNAYVRLALSHDALELLKMSSLFQKIGDNSLSMKIIGAYDSCELMVADIRRFFETRDAQDGDPSAWLLDNNPQIIKETKVDLETAIEAIDAFLAKQ